ncbi:hypothetical protein TEHOK1_10980 [Tetragenococcus halophilus]|nr:hypothetical protein WJ7_16230 [Tetragenococcus halophilus]GMG70409.1 hypothetical protein TEHOK1_10980 [Tetragenococcus halophilus]
MTSIWTTKKRLQNKSKLGLQFKKIVVIFCGLEKITIISFLIKNVKEVIYEGDFRNGRRKSLPNDTRG